MFTATWGGKDIFSFSIPFEAIGFGERPESMAINIIRNWSNSFNDQVSLCDITTYGVHNSAELRFGAKNVCFSLYGLGALRNGVVDLRGDFYNFSQVNTSAEVIVELRP